MNTLPYHIVNIIYQYDSTYKQIYDYLIQHITQECRLQRITKLFKKLRQYKMRIQYLIYLLEIYNTQNTNTFIHLLTHHINSTQCCDQYCVEVFSYIAIKNYFLNEQEVNSFVNYHIGITNSLITDTKYCLKNLFQGQRQEEQYYYIDY